MSWADAIANNILKVEALMLLVQIAGLAGLFPCVRETKAIREATEEQIDFDIEDRNRAAGNCRQFQLRQAD